MDFALALCEARTPVAPLSEAKRGTNSPPLSNSRGGKKSPKSILRDESRLVFSSGKGKFLLGSRPLGLSTKRTLGLRVGAQRTDSEDSGTPLGVNRREMLLGSALFLTTAERALAEVQTQLEAADSSSESSGALVPDSPPEVPTTDPSLPSESSSPEPSPSTSEVPPSKPSEPAVERKSPDTTITDRVYFDFSLCPTAARADRTLGDTSLICSDGEPLGRVVIGLYGKQVPRTVENFKAMVTGKAGSTYKSTVVHKILQGQYIQIGRQGSPDRGEVSPPEFLERNTETVVPSSFKLKHNRPGIVSLCLSENDDDEARKLSPEFRNVEFMITTGPGPAPQLDNNNVVFGIVLEGIDVISSIASVPTYRPSERIRQFNDLAEFLGDERALNARNLWNRPLRSIVISDCNVIDISLPPLPPYMP